jgi:hypothetical protein
MGRNNKRRNNKSIFSQNRGQAKTEVKHNPQLHNYSNWSWQHKILFIQVQNNRQSNVPMQKGHQTVQHITLDCPLLEQDRGKLQAVMTRIEKWSVNCNKLGTHKKFKEYIDKISWSKE